MWKPTLARSVASECKGRRVICTDAGHARGIAGPAHTSEKGCTYATAQVRVPTDDDAMLCSVIVFEDAAVAALLARDKGDAVAASGTAKLSRWTCKDGTERIGLSVTAHRIMSAYTATKKRQAKRENADDGDDDRKRVNWLA